MAEEWLQSSIKADNGFINAIVTKGFEFRVIEQGGFWVIWWNFSLGNGGTAELLFKSGNNSTMSVYVGDMPSTTVVSNASGVGYGRIQAWEGSTVSADGNQTGLTYLAMNRQSQQTPVFNLYNAPTVTSYGTEIMNRLTYIGGSLTSGLNAKFKKNTNYVYKVTNLGVSTVLTTFMMFVKQTNDIDNV